MLENSFSFTFPKELNMYYCGKRIQSPNHVYGPEIRSHFLIVLIKEGHATFYAKNRNIRLKPNDLFIMFPGEKIHYTVDKDVLWTISWVGLYGKLVQEFFDALGVNSEYPIIHLNHAYDIAEIFDRIYEESFINSFESKSRCISLLYEFFALLFKDKEICGETDFCSDAKSIIDHNFDKKISVDYVAGILHVNPAYFSRAFRKKTGQSPKEYIMNKKIDYAKKLLEGSSLSVKELSGSIGFSDPLYFSRLFKRKTGMSPSEYREFNKR